MSLLPWLSSVIPKFYCHGSQVEIITSPKAFNETLQKYAVNAKKRIVIASLYLGTGEREASLVQNIGKACMTEERPSSLRVRILLENTRGSRLVTPSNGSVSKVSSRTMLVPLMNAHPNNLRVFLFHSPNFRGWRKQLLGGRLNEVVSNLQHTKVYLFDDTLVVSGANLSRDYFTQRQDRFMVFKNVPKFADFMEDLVETISSVSYELQHDNTLVSPADVPDPLVGDKTIFFNQFKQRINTLLSQYTDTPVIQSDQSDTVVAPMLQLGFLGIRHDEHSTQQLLHSSDIITPSSHLTLASGYLNIISKYRSLLINKAQSANIKVLSAAPEANGFFNGKTLDRFIPAYYTQVALNFLAESRAARLGSNQLTYHEYNRPGWTFHAKGLWLARPSEEDRPHLTLIGSSNFNYRSADNDIECQLALETTNENLQLALGRERDFLMSHSCCLTRDDLENDNSRKVPFWLQLIAPLIQRFF